MTDRIEELRKRGMITSLAKVPVSKTDRIEALRGLVSAAVRKVTGCPDIKAGELSLVSEICAALAALPAQPEAQVGGEVAAVGEPSAASMTQAFIERYESRYTPHTVELVMAEVRMRARELDSTTPPPSAVPEGVVRVEVAVVSELMDALHSFASSAEDDESYTVPSELMSRLAMLGAVYRAKREGWYYLTDFGRMLLTAAPEPGEG